MKLLFALLTLSSPAHATFLVYGDTLKAHEGTAQDYDRASRTDSHANASFKIEGEPEIKGKEVKIKGTLENTSTSKQTVFMRARPFTLKIKEWPKPDQDAGSLMVLELPPRSVTELAGVIDLETYDYQGEPPVTLEWKFNFWTAPFPKGAFKLTLPARVKVADTFKIEIGTMTNSSRPDEKTMIASIKNATESEQKVKLEHGEWSLVDSQGVPVALAKGTTSRDAVLAAGQATELERATLVGRKLTTAAGEAKELKSGIYQLKYRIDDSSPNAKQKSVETVMRLDVP